jgi:hypothetical protein
VSFSIQFENISEIQKYPSDLSTKVHGVFLETAHALVQGATNATRNRVASGSQKPRSGTGRYLQSIHAEVEANPFQVIGKVASDHPQAAVLEFGSRPHVIKPKNKKKLFWPGARFPVKEIHHPGTPAFKVLGGAAEQVVESADAIFNQVLGKHFS